MIDPTPTSVELSRSLTFSAAHRLPKVPAGHPCGRVHGHNYTVTLWYRAPIDPEMGWAFDTKEIDEVLAVVKDSLDHRDLNALGFPGLENPTAENVGLWIFRLASATVPIGRYLDRVEISETGRGSFIIRKELQR
jgi:6-pyruvoyltetrahydropterin/6-carboxytetrahydropterin synthase